MYPENYRKALEFCEQRRPVEFEGIFGKRELYKTGYQSLAHVYVTKDDYGIISSVYKVFPFYVDQQDQQGNEYSLEEALNYLRPLEAIRTLSKSLLNSITNFSLVENCWIVKDTIKGSLKDADVRYSSICIEEHLIPENTGVNYLVVKFEYGGKPLLNLNRLAPSQLVSVVAQVALSVQAAQNELEFEHRNLDLSNILVRNTSEEYLEYIINARRISVPTWGVRITITDFSCARFKYNNQVYFHPFPESMKDSLFLLTEKGNWEGFYPATNNWGVRSVGHQMLDIGYHLVGATRKGVALYENRLWLDNLKNCDNFVDYFEHELLPLIRKKRFSLSTLLKWFKSETVNLIDDQICV